MSKSNNIILETQEKKASKQKEDCKFEIQKKTAKMSVLELKDAFYTRILLTYNFNQSKYQVLKKGGQKNSFYPSGPYPLPGMETAQFWSLKEEIH